MGGNVIEGRFVLVLDQFFEAADFLGTTNVDREDKMVILGEKKAIEFKCDRHATSK